MTTDAGAIESYRTSHASAGYGARYEETYRRGYFRYQWEKIERPLLESVFAAVPDRTGKAYLDFACGTGRILEVGARYFESATGVDISMAMLERARGNVPRAVLVERDITDRPLDTKFDVITAFRFFLNAEPALADAAAESLREMLKPGGLLISNIHVNSASVTGMAYRLRNKLKGRSVANVRSYRDYLTFLEKHGFAVRETFWYSYLPRTGWRLEWLPKYLMSPIEAIVRRIPGAKRTAQSFLVVAEKVR